MRRMHMDLLEYPIPPGFIMNICKVLMVTFWATFCVALGGCMKLTPAQEAEQAFIKLFEHDYPAWKVTKIVLTPCKGANLYRGCFDCTAETYVSKCWMMKKVTAEDDWTTYIPTTKTFEKPCNENHWKGERLTWSVVVTYAHGDCYYKLGKTATEYE